MPPPPLSLSLGTLTSGTKRCKRYLAINGWLIENKQNSLGKNREIA